jgi:hypothetical protein
MSTGALLALIVCAAVLLAAVGAVGFLTLVKAGIIVRHAVKPTHQDYGNYTLDQGREVRPEEERQGERS